MTSIRAFRSRTDRSFLREEKKAKEALIISSYKFFIFIKGADFCSFLICKLKRKAGKKLLKIDLCGFYKKQRWKIISVFVYSYKIAQSNVERKKRILSIPPKCRKFFENLKKAIDKMRSTVYYIKWLARANHY